MKCIICGSDITESIGEIHPNLVRCLAAMNERVKFLEAQLPYVLYKPFSIPEEKPPHNPLRMRR